MLGLNVKIVNLVLSSIFLMVLIAGCDDQAPSAGQAAVAVENAVEDVVDAVESATELEPAADTVLLNGKILTVDENFSVAQAIAIKAGRIIAVGSEEDIALYSNDAAEVIDLHGKTVIPGFIDSNMHFFRAAQHWSQENDNHNVEESHKVATNTATKEPERKIIEQRQNVLDAIAMMNAVGVTSVYDVGRSERDDVTMLYDMSERASLNLRIWHALRYQVSDSAGVESVVQLIKSAEANNADDYLGMFGIGEHLYLPLDDLLSADTFYAEDVFNKFKEAAMVAAEEKFRVTETFMFDETVSNILDVYEMIDEEIRLRPLRWSLGNVHMMSDESIQRANNIGLSVIVHSVENHSEALNREQPPIRKLQDSGMIWGLSTGHSLDAHYQPFAKLGWVVTGKSINGKILMSQDNTLTR